MGSVREDFSEFVAGNATRLLRMAVLLTDDRAAAEDLLQDTLERVYVAWPRVEEPFAYVRTALVRQATNRWRRRARRPEAPLMDWDPASSLDHSQRTVERITLHGALAALPPRQRAVVVLRFLEDLSEAETARHLGCSAGTVKSQSSRALTRLRAVMSATATGPPAAGTPGPTPAAMPHLAVEGGRDAL